MNFYDVLLAKNLGGGGSTPSVDIEPLSITQNGVYEAPAGKAYDPVTVDVPTGGGASNIVTGTFIGTAKGISAIELPYSGTGFPIAFVIIPKGGAMANIGSLESNQQAIIGMKQTTAAPSAGLSKYFNGSYVKNNYGDLTFNGFNNLAMAYINGTNFGVGFRDATHLNVRFTDTTGEGFVLGKEFIYVVVYSSDA